MVETVASRLIELATTPFWTSMTMRAVCGRSAKVDIPNVSASADTAQLTAQWPRTG